MPLGTTQLGRSSNECPPHPGISGVIDSGGEGEGPSIPSAALVHAHHPQTLRDPRAPELTQSLVQRALWLQRYIHSTVGVWPI